MTARTKLIALERLHTLLVIVLGSAAAITVLNLLEKPEPVLNQFAYMGGALAVGYVTAYLADLSIAVAVRGLRARLQAAIHHSA